MLAKIVCPSSDQLGHRKELARLWALGPGLLMALQGDLGWAGWIGVERNPEQVSDV